MRELELGGASGDAEVLAEVQPEPSSSPESFCSSQGNEHSWQLQSGLEVMQGELVGILAELEGDSQDQVSDCFALLTCFHLNWVLIHCSAASLPGDLIG